MRWDCIREKEGQVGADTLAASVLYMMCMYNRYWHLALLCTGVDMLYYGPQVLAAPVSAAAMSFVLF